jgi:hypothetical protein
MKIASGEVVHQFIAGATDQLLFYHYAAWVDRGVVNSDDCI